MPKRKREENNDFKSISRKLKKLEQELKKCRRPRPIIETSSSSSASSREPSPSPRNKQDGDKGKVSDTAPATFTDARDDSLADIVDGHRQRAPAPAAATDAASAATDPASGAGLEANSSTASAQESSAASDNTLDNIVLEILGDDPTASVQYGSDIHKDLASRFEHLATNGLNKDIRKELNNKYLIPANCTHTGAPILNVEIKAALPEAMVKRDKAIEARQKQLATAIACLTGAMTDQLSCKKKNHDLLKKLMDTGRLLCDLQFAESTTRRKFAMFSLKRDMKEHLANTKIDKHLFGNNLSEALKTAKAVNKSSSDLKAPVKNIKKPIIHQQKSNNTEGKNWKAPASIRRPAAAGALKSREPALRRNQYPSSSKRSSPPPKTIRRQ